MHTLQYVHESQWKALPLSLPLQGVGPGDWTWVIRSGGRCLYLVSRLLSRRYYPGTVNSVFAGFFLCFCCWRFTCASSMLVKYSTAKLHPIALEPPLEGAIPSAAKIVLSLVEDPLLCS